MFLNWDPSNFGPCKLLHIFYDPHNKVFFSFFILGQLSGGNCPGGNFPGGDCPRAICRGNCFRRNDKIKRNKQGLRWYHLVKSEYAAMFKILCSYWGMRTSKIVNRHSEQQTIVSFQAISFLVTMMQHTREPISEMHYINSAVLDQ